MTASLPSGTSLTYRGRKLELSRWLERHPGGMATLRACMGTDATVPLHMFHDMRSPMMQKWVQKFDAGPDPERPLREFDRDYLALEEEFLARGWFQPSLRWYVVKTATVVAFLGLALALPNPWLKGLFLGLFIHQSAFLGHDTCHDAAFPRKWRERMAWWFGPVSFGMNHGDWTRQHNLHHLLVNRPLDDPQLNNLPQLLYAAHEVEFFERRKRPLRRGERWLISYSYLWLVPLLLLYGRLNAIRAEIRRAKRCLRKPEQSAWHADARAYLKGVVLHGALFAVVVTSGILLGGAAWWTYVLAVPFVALALSSILHLQLILSHGHRPRLYQDEQEALGMKVQVLSNQNITASFLTAWFHGGLENHIEHHLFPRMPRHNLPKIREHVRELCRKHDLPYETAPFFPCVWRFLKSLHRESSAVRAQLRVKRSAEAA